MIIYNVTVKVDSDVNDDWLEWMLKHHILDVMKTGLFIDYRISRLIGLDEEDGISYSIQYSLESVDKLNRYFEHFAPGLQEDHSSRFKDKFVAYRTVMEVVSTS